MATATASAKQTIERRLRSNADYLRFLPSDPGRLAATGIQVEEYLREHPEMLAVIYVDHQLEVQWIAPRATAGGVFVPNVLSGEASRAAAQAALQTSTVVYTPPEITVGGVTGFEVHVPVLDEEGPSGVLIGVYSFHRLLRHVLPRDTIQGHRLRIVDGSNGAHHAALPSGGATDDRLVGLVDLDPPGHHVQLQLARYIDSPWSTSVRVLSLLCLILVAGIGYGMWSLNREVIRRRQSEEAIRVMADELEERVAARTRDLQRANAQLEQEAAERLAAEQRSRGHQEQLARVGRISMMGELAAGLAHELHQPLGAIASFSQGCLRLSENLQGNVPAIRRGLEEIGQQSLRAGQIIHKLREFLGNRSATRVPTAVEQVTQEIVALIAPEARQADVRLVLEIQPALPPVAADPIQLQQVLLNLLRNGMEAVQPQDKPRWVRLTVDKGPGQPVRFEVTDSGVGCSEETFQRMFDPFFTTKVTGLGMGLAISRSIVESHGSELVAYRTPSGNIRFTFLIAAAQEVKEG